MERVVITGLGAITPIGKNTMEYWNNLLNGDSGADKITRFDTTNFKTKFACEIKNYEALDYFDRKEARKMDRFTQYGLICVDEAVKDAELDFSKLNVNRIGVIFSSGIGGFETFEHEVIDYAKGNFQPKFNPFFITKIISNGLSGIISINYGLRGVNYCPVTACASSTQSIIQAFNYIRLGKADIVITGGSEAPITASSIGGFNAMKAMSTNNENFGTASRPFDTSRDGFVVGEGAGALIVESLGSAIKRGAKIYAEIVGGGESSDAYHITGTHPEGTGAFLAMREGIKEANLNPNNIDYVNAHATSTGLGDLSEIKAIEKLFSSNLDKIQVSASKSMTGHLLGGTGAIEAISTCLSVKTDLIPPTINTTEIDENIPKELNLSLGSKAFSKTVNYALSNSFGFGGHCGALILKKYIY
ncbi:MULTISPECIES: beta-ketoacyl-ACP synthase II [Bacteroidota]|jgi:3-oxoacyl-[acyl-carrier-protein] synthase II|uniref:3-oxoacyl-[acyl-carrier-protein] synthase 2 n=6 Tax=Bacteroidota TaxID=976 RepID=A0A1X7HXD1_9SPHI|nr:MULTISPECIES: beta-ketoacyl-ACP synthase II [Bacteroidota]ALU27754.1 beta-ketoacyl-[acyl-carrier-protein] synthase II [Myroides odoratimimus]EHM7981475.1 beta-ketoacyl-ACP synthase II [Elizabethkingia anophelis]EHM8033078.1 beta-ketoacyl-ACP synthase II [Elizabethkingia anophelis]EHZ9535686.1 beta-ketoacyl-ACP synthase II [Elizabethkingia anophelis]EKU3673594.1 beta-ketoacyl-ACP synthase II [Elizabethkingia anophelis]